MTLHRSRDGALPDVARSWLLLAVASLLLAGLLALLLVIGRTPPLDRLVGDPLLFKRGLVVHVDLSLCVWFYAFLAGLFSLLPSRRRAGPLTRVAPAIGGAGVLLLVLAAAIPGAVPLLANYIPVIDHPLFLIGLLLFAVAVACALVDPRLIPSSEPGDEGLLPASALPGIRAAALALMLALLTFFAAWLNTPAHLEKETYFEVFFWGGGHVLQVASVAAMLAAWIALHTPALGKPPLRRATAALLFGALLVPILPAPLVAMQETVNGSYRLAFTHLMRWGIFPPVSLALVGCLAAIHAAKRRGALPRGVLGDWRIVAFLTSAALCVLGFVLGALIRGSNTMVPAHYHAAIGAVTASFMGLTWLLLGPLGMPVPERLRRLAGLQPVFFGVGQAIFAVGFGVAGAFGMGRKAYGHEQLARSLPETLGLLVMGLGGLLAVLGGLLFLWIALSSWRHARTSNASHLAERSTSWTLKDPAPLSRS